MNIQPVIMSGGSGTRLWPLSRRARPKQFLNLTGDRSLFQETVLRMRGPGYADPLIIAGADHAELVKTQLAGIGVKAAAIILEPAPRNTAAVAAVAALWTVKHNPNAAVLLAPADHHIEDAEAFRAAVARGSAGAARGNIVTFGIKPGYAHTGYGYIEKAAELAPDVYAVAAFREKPDAKTAEGYLKGGRYFWNAGIFLFAPGAMIAELESHAPGVADHARRALDNAANTNGALTLDPATFADCPSISIDYAVMEKTAKAAVVAPVDCGWSDIGSWSEAKGGDAAAHMLVDSANVSIHSDGVIVGAVGVEDLIIVATGDAVLVARRDRAQDVRAIVDELKKRGREDLL
ncbi:MAG: mannose-1-phosphate guanylyltransferase/mannose-6-phosphate isomerase [Parvularculaceae bacterium]